MVKLETCGFSHNALQYMLLLYSVFSALVLVALSALAWEEIIVGAQYLGVLLDIFIL